MKIKVIRINLLQDEYSKFGINPDWVLDFESEPENFGQEFHVLGIDYTINSPSMGTGVSFWYKRNGAFPLHWLPSYFFEITDPRPSSHWIMKSYGNGGYALKPQEFYNEYYYDDVHEYRSPAIESYNEIYSKIAKEFESKPYYDS